MYLFTVLSVVSFVVVFGLWLSWIFNPYNKNSTLQGTIQWALMFSMASAMFVVSKKKPLFNLHMQYLYLRNNFFCSSDLISSIYSLSLWTWRGCLHISNGSIHFLISSTKLWKWNRKYLSILRKRSLKTNYLLHAINIRIIIISFRNCKFE
jgi:hypothetical protein